MKTDDYTERTIWRLSWKGLTRTEIARALGVTEGDVMRILAGEPRRPLTKPETEQRP